MASRHLNSDRFFTTGYNARIYTQTGLDWMDDNDMSTVLLSHLPDLLPALRVVGERLCPMAEDRSMTQNSPRHL